MAVGTVELRYPLAGLDKGAGFERQAPYSARSMLNCVPLDPFKETDRGGSRWGLDKAFYSQPTLAQNGLAVRLLANVDIVDLQNKTFWDDPFIATDLGPLWSAITLTSGNTGLTTVSGMPTVYDRMAACESAAAALHKAAVRSSFSPFLQTNPTVTPEYRLEAYIVPFRGRSFGTVELFFRMASASFDAQGVAVRLVFTDTLGSTAGTIRTRKGSANIDAGTNLTTTSPGIALPGWLSVRVTNHVEGGAGGTVNVYWRGTQILTNYVIGSTLWTGGLVGFGLDAPVISAWTGTTSYSTLGILRRPTVANGFAYELTGTGTSNPTDVTSTWSMRPDALITDGTCQWRCMNYPKAQIDTFRFIYRIDTPTNRSILVASAGGEIMREATFNDPQPFDPAITPALISGKCLQSAQRGQVLYVADVGTVKGQVTGAAALTDPPTLSFDTNNAFLNYTLGAFTTLGIDTTQDLVQITPASGTSAAAAYTWRIVSVVSNTQLKLQFGPGYITTNAPCNYRIERGPKEYLVQSSAIRLWGNAANLMSVHPSNYISGPLPLGCPIIAAWQDRAIMGGAVAEPHILNVSRQGDWYDFDDSTDPADPQRAFRFGTNNPQALSATPGPPLTGVIPHSYDYALVACRDQMFRLVGSPTLSATMENISRVIGMVDKQAYCLTPDGAAVWLSHDGLYGIEAAGGSFPVKLSLANGRDRLPQELREIDRNVHTVMMAFERRMNGVLIFVSPHASHWFFHWPTKTFWPLAIHSDLEPYAILEHRSQSAVDHCVLMGCADGYIRRFHPRHHRDGSFSFESYVYFGPVLLGRGADDEGLLNEIVARLAKDSAALNWSIQVGDTVEDALAATARWTGSFVVAGLTARSHPRSVGRYAFVKIANNGGTTYRPWALEALAIAVQAAGLQRVA